MRRINIASGIRTLAACTYRRFAGVFVAVVMLVPLGHAQGPNELPELQAKGTTYRNVRVISRNPSSITVRHSGGIAQILFKDMSPEVQAQFGFVADEMEAFEQGLRRQAEEAAARLKQELAARGNRRASVGEQRIDRIAQSFETEPQLKGVDMRPRLRELELHVKDQGRSPSCSVFAVVSALELQNYEVTGRPQKLSEPYLVWATHQIAGARERVVVDQDGAGVLDDSGFSLIEVFHALNRFGIPTQEALERHLAGQSGVTAMPPALVQEAMLRSGVVAYAVPGRDKAAVARNIIHVLNNGLPVVLALRWPHWRSSQGGLLSSQEPIPSYAHAVTVVGYTSESGGSDDLRLIFKNSWGPKWGAFGYGFAEMKYLSQHLIGAAFMDVVASPEQGR